MQRGLRARSALALLLLLAAVSSAHAHTISLDNGLVRRELAEDGGVWRTVSFSRSNGADRLSITSDEIHLLLFDDATLTLSDYEAAAAPRTFARDGVSHVIVTYRRRPGRGYPPSAPLGFVIDYFARRGEPYLRKRIELDMPAEAEIDRLEVERFVTPARAARGGRGEPVYLDDRWFVGVEYPAAHSRHTDGNTPRAGSGHFDTVGNYSHIDLEGRDVEPRATPGLVRLMHFPGRARPAEGGRFRITSQTAVAGTGRGGSMETVFGDYLATIRRKPRSFLNYNNWFDPDGKKLDGDGLLAVWRAFRERLAPLGIRMDAMVPDDGWQDKATLFAPKTGHFPRGLDDLAALGDTLRREGTALGLWLPLSSYNMSLPDMYPRAQPNEYFAAFRPYYPLAHPRYKEDLAAQLRRLIGRGRLAYLKHDFNPLADQAAGRGHPATQRHGHEAELDAMLDLMALERSENPDLYLNVTNWVWFSPWWLLHADALWMLAGDDGFNTNWPELSGRAMATTDRDTYLWRMWGDPERRPLVPVSSLMTHGVIRNRQGRMELPHDTLADWADHVVMHYGRGVGLKEWYISPSSLSEDHWKVLLRVHRWAEHRFPALVNTTFVGGRPDEGRAYGYVGWDGEAGVLVARNPQARTQVLRVPLSAKTLYRGRPGLRYRTRILYPYRGDGPAVAAGGPLELALPGYTTVALELEPGRGQSPVATPAPPRWRRAKGKFYLEVPNDVSPQATVGSERGGAAPGRAEATLSRCELLVIGYPSRPEVRLAGRAAEAARTASGRPNQFAGYARAGMPRENAHAWEMAAFDLRAHRGRTVEVEVGASSGELELWWLLDRPVPEGPAADSPDEPWPILHGYRRQTIALSGR